MWERITLGGSVVTDVVTIIVLMAVLYALLTRRRAVIRGARRPSRAFGLFASLTVFLLCSVYRVTAAGASSPGVSSDDLLMRLACLLSAICLWGLVEYSERAARRQVHEEATTSRLILRDELITLRDGLKRETEPWGGMGHGAE